MPCNSPVFFSGVSAAVGVKSVTTGEHKNALTQLSAIDLFAKKHGITIIAVDSLTDAEGNAINGEYRTGNNIVISLDADGGLYMPVVGHEIFHYAESINAEDAKALAELIIDTLKASKGAEWLEARRREYEGYGYKDGEIDSEIAADFFGAAVTQKDFERQIKAAELNKSFTQKIIDKVKEVVAELKEIMQKLRGQRLIYDAALDTDAETLDFFVDNLERILNQAGTETKNTATEDGVKYQLKVGAAADVEKALKDKNYRDDVYLTESSPAVIANQNGVRNLPMLMKASHIRENVFTEDEARQRGLKVDKNINYHGLGKNLFLKIIDGLDDVQYAYRGTKNADNPSRRENYFLLISQYKDGDGNTINIPVYINEKGSYNRVFIDTNKIATVYGKENFSDYIQKEVRKGNLVRIKNKSTQASERTTPIVAGYSLNASVDTTVTQKSPSVNSILSEKPKKITTETKKIAENSGVKRQNKISVEMNDAERAEVLRNSAIDIVKYKGNVEDLNAANVLALQETYRANAAPVLKKLAEKFGVFDKTYFNKNISLDFSYSRGSLKESVNKQGKVSTDFYDFAKMLYVFDDVVNNAVPIEAHTDKYAGTERANQNLKYDYVLLSAFSDGDYIIPVEMHIKEFSNKDPNKLYVSITLGKIKTEDGILAHPSKRKNVSANVTPPSSKINVAQLISKVNPGFSDFYKYIPSELLTEAQISSKTVALDDEKYRLGVLRGEDVSGMLRKKAEKAGYSPDDSWKMDHRAPKYGYHTLSRVLRLSIGTWEGDMNSFSANILNGITKLISVFGDQLNDEIFKEKVGAISVKQLVRTAKERHAGSMGYAEAMLIEYNGKKKNPAQRLSMNKLHARESSIFSGLSDLEEQEDSADEEDDNLFDELD